MGVCYWLDDAGCEKRELVVGHLTSSRSSSTLASLSQLNNSTHECATRWTPFTKQTNASDKQTNTNKIFSSLNNSTNVWMWHEKTNHQHPIRGSFGQVQLTQKPKTNKLKRNSTHESGLRWRPGIFHDLVNWKCINLGLIMLSSVWANIVLVWSVAEPAFSPLDMEYGCSCNWGNSSQFFVQLFWVSMPVN